jgi:hypothetical protein
MHNRIGVLLASALGLCLCLLATPEARAQYRCAVGIELKGKTILAGQIRDTERPETDQLWELLKTLSFSPTSAAKDLPDPKTAERATLKGDLRVKVDGAGQVQLEELRLVRNKFDPTAWVIAPEDVTRILKLRKAAGGSDENRKK